MKTLLAAAALVAVASTAFADMDARIREHIDWITENTDLEYNGEALPLVLYDTPRNLLIMAYGFDAVLEAESSESLSLASVLAVYDPENDVMFLREDYDPERDDFILVHELVHYLHDIGGQTEAAPCLAATEAEAYGIQRDWQDAHDDPNPRPDPLFVVLISQCHRDY